jgi:hypothetical protein
MHVYTIVRVWAENEEEAIEKVNAFMEEYHDDVFDYYDEESTHLSDKVKTEEDFQQIRQKELDEYKSSLEEALAMPDNDWLKGFTLRQAGTSLDPDIWNSPCRLAFDHATHIQEEPEEGESIYFVVTDRHY